MSIAMDVRNTSLRRHLYRRDVLLRVAARVLAGEGVKGAVELSVLFCDDPEIATLNREWRQEPKATDVLSFEQPAPTGVSPRPLGDIVISLETVERRNEGDRDAMRAEVRLLFCHGLLHLLGHDHRNVRETAAMQSLQAEYLGVDAAAAWIGPVHTATTRRTLGVGRRHRR